MAQKVGRGAVTLSVGGAASPSNTMSLGPRPTSVPSGILILFDFNTIYGSRPISATVWPLKTTSGFGKSGNNVSERRLTSNTTVTVERCDI